MSFVEGRINRE